MAEQAHKKTKIIVKELKHIHSGTTKAGSDYTIQQVIATKVDGTAIDLNLRTFDELPKDEPIEVTVEKFESPQYGISYTIKPAGKSGGMGKSIDELRGRVVKLEAQVAELMRGQPAPSVAPPPPAPATPPPAAAPAGGLPSDDQIPF